MEPLLDVKDLHTNFYTSSGVVRAVNGVSLYVNPGEVVGVVGESGCGKTVTMRSVMRIIPSPPGRIDSGQILFKNQDLLKLSDEQIRRIRGKEIAMVFQDPMTSLNPVLTVGRQITEILTEHMQMDKTDAWLKAEELLNIVGIPHPKIWVREYPHQLSGGMRQRVMIAMALACNPDLLIADEPTTALDVTIQLQIVNLVKRLQQQIGLSVIWITHDLGVVARLIDRVMVMYAGYIVESASVKELYKRPTHPYTKALLSSLPRIDASGKRRLNSIPGQPPDLSTTIIGCPFAPRCSYAVETCTQENPKLETIADGHHVACWEISRTGGLGK